MNSPNRHTALSGPIDWELMFCSHVLDLPALHWGLWEPDAPLTLDNLRAAQHRFTERVACHVLHGAPRTVLDVGCGRGDGALRLLDGGAHVTAITPVSNERDRLSSLGAQGLRFVQSTFEAFTAEGPFDAIVMSESCGHWPIATTFAKSAELLAPGGRLVVANMFRLQAVRRPLGKHVLGDFMRAAEQHGFSVRTDEDITGQVLPTLTLYRRWLSRHGRPAIDFAEAFVRQRRRRHLGVAAAGVVVRPMLRRLRRRLDHYAERLDADAFAVHSTYRILVFERAGRA